MTPTACFELLECYGIFRPQSQAGESGTDVWQSPIEFQQIIPPVREQLGIVGSGHKLGEREQAVAAPGYADSGHVIVAVSEVASDGDTLQVEPCSRSGVALNGGLMPVDDQTTRQRGRLTRLLEGVERLEAEGQPPVALRAAERSLDARTFRFRTFLGDGRCSRFVVVRARPKCRLDHF